MQEKLAPVDFLSLLLSDEIARREQQRFTTRLRRAAFHTAKTIEQFDFDRTAGLCLSWLAAFAGISGICSGYFYFYRFLNNSHPKKAGFY